MTRFHRLVYRLARPWCRMAGSAQCLIAGSVLALAVVWGGACGPIRYLDRVSQDAARAVAEAKGAGAEDEAPYLYWSAVEYLEMAHEKAGYADFELSLKYGERASRFAKKAKDRALERKARAPAGPAPPRDHRVRAEIPSRISN